MDAMKNSKKCEYWGEASGLDEEGKERGVSIYRNGSSFRLVNDNLQEHVPPSHRKLNEENIRREIAEAFHYRDIEFAFPQFGLDFRNRD